MKFAKFNCSFQINTGTIAFQMVTMCWCRPRHFSTIHSTMNLTQPDAFMKSFILDFRSHWSDYGKFYFSKNLKHFQPFANYYGYTQTACSLLFNNGRLWQDALPLQSPIGKDLDIFYSVLIFAINIVKFLDKKYS